MTTQDRIIYILRKNTETRYNKKEFCWRYGEMFYGFKFYATPDQFRDFMKDYSTIERSYREVLKLKEFQLPPEADSKRYEKAAQFKEKYKEK